MYDIITPEHKRIPFEQMIDEIKDYMGNRPNSKIIVGADSQKVRSRFCFATAIAIIDPGNGGIFYIRKEYKKPHRNMNVQSTISWKVWEEAQYICAMFSDLIEHGIEIDEKISHHDISEAGLSREHIASIKGFMTSMGFNPEIKPNAVIASGIANSFSKK